MDAPVLNTEADTEDGITDRNIVLQGPPKENSSKLSRNCSAQPRGLRDSINGEKEKIKEERRKTKKDPLLHANYQVLFPNRVTKKKILLFIKKLESSPRLRKAGGTYQKI